eukprot:COSAG01_NODE_858_length_13069_cov_23.641943_1_plen_32_part_10
MPRVRGWMYATIDVDFSIADALLLLHALSMHG